MNDFEKIRIVECPNLLGLEAEFFLLQEVANAGNSVILKIDGGRDRDVFSVIFCNNKIDSTPFRRDGSDLRKLMRELIVAANKE